MVVKLSREMTGQRGFSFMDKFHLNLKLKTLSSATYRGFASLIRDGVMYRAKIGRVANGIFGSVVFEFVFQSGSRVRFLVCNGCHPNTIPQFSSEHSVRADRIVNLAEFDSWRDVRKTIIRKLAESEDARGNVGLYRK